MSNERIEKVITEITEEAWYADTVECLQLITAAMLCRNSEPAAHPMHKLFAKQGESVLATLRLICFSHDCGTRILKEQDIILRLKKCPINSKRGSTYEYVLCVRGIPLCLITVECYGGTVGNNMDTLYSWAIKDVDLLLQNCVETLNNCTNSYPTIDKLDASAFINSLEFYSPAAAAGGRGHN